MGKTGSTGKRGFTLIEVSIVTIISGLIFMAVFDLYGQYLKQRQSDTTDENIQLAAGAIGSFLVSNRYPCPSDRTLAKNNANFGREIDPNAVTNGFCDLGPTGLNLIPSPVPAGWLGACYTTGVGVTTPAGTNGVGGVCAFPCASAACADGSGQTKNIVVIGGIPIKSINALLGTSYSSSIILDGWDHQLDYVVTYKLTNGGQYKYNLGAISVVDENGTATAGFADDAHYGIVSHGPDGKGGYTINGQMFEVCGANNPQSYNTGDDQNCSNNAEFIAGIRNNSRTAAHNDDTVYFVKTGMGSLWNTVGLTSDIKNLNLGRVNVGTSADPLESDGVTVDPNVALFVGDPNGASNGILHVANNTKAGEICDKNGSNCFRMNALTNAACQQITCPAGQVMTGIYTDNVTTACCTTAPCTHATCTTPNFTPKAAVQTCAAGKWLAGIDTSGTIICQ